MTVARKYAFADELTVKLWFMHSIYCGKFMSQLQTLICSLAPESCREVYVEDEDPDAIVIDTSETDWMAKALTAFHSPPVVLPWEVGDEGEKATRQPYEDGHCQERSGAWQIMFMSGNGIFGRVGNGWRFKNALIISFGASCTGAQRGAEIATRCLRAAVECWDPVFAYACMTREYDAKNVAEGPGFRKACGLEFDRHLPGVYWATYFGSQYMDFLGHERVMSSPARRVESAGNGAIIFLAEAPSHWRRDGYRQTEKKVREHLGVEHFWDRRHPCRGTESPDLGFPSAPLRADFPGVSRDLPVGRAPRVLLRRCLFSVSAAALGITAIVLMEFSPKNAVIAAPLAVLGFLLGVIGCVRFLLYRETYVVPAFVGLGLSSLVLGAAFLLFTV